MFKNITKTEVGFIFAKSNQSKYKNESLNDEVTIKSTLFSTYCR